MYSTVFALTDTERTAEQSWCFAKVSFQLLLASQTTHTHEAPALLLSAKPLFGDTISYRLSSVMGDHVYLFTVLQSTSSRRDEEMRSEKPS